MDLLRIPKEETVLSLERPAR